VTSTSAYQVRAIASEDHSLDYWSGCMSDTQPVPTNATYFNNAAATGADPYVLYDKGSGYYYAYSTDGAGPGAYFAVYRSPDLATWEQIPGGALPADDPKQWANDWFWAPEVYHNEKTGLYFLFYAARMNRDVAAHFRYADFEEACKVGVAVSRSPAGPFHNITNAPIDYYPYDPAYHDVNLIMDATQKKPPATIAEGQTAPLGTYIPYIDPDVMFDEGRIYLYFSRNAYRNWVWDTDLGKYIEESNIYAVELTSDWWNDPTGHTMPGVQPRYINANKAAGDSAATRKDGFTPILRYGADKQPWENAHVDDYAKSNGQKKDRRWEEGSTTFRVNDSAGRGVYYLTYSANNHENPYYGVGYAVSDSPLGPFRKSTTNPVLAQNTAKGMYSTGHGSVIASPDSAQLYYVHHGRPATSTNRKLYTERMRCNPDTRGLVMDQSTSDVPIPSGVAPYSVIADTEVVSGGQVLWQVLARDGGAMYLPNPLNRVTATIFPPDAATVRTDAEGATITDVRRRGTLTLTYQRQHASGGYFDVRNGRHPVSLTLPVRPEER
jgi:hypothetical protein